MLERLRISLQSTHTETVVRFEDKTNPTLNCESIKVCYVWHSPSHQLRLWMTEDESTLIRECVVTKMNLFKGAVSCAVFLSFIKFRLETFQVCE